MARRNALVEGLRHSWCQIAHPGRGVLRGELPIDNADAFCQWMLEHFDLEGDTVMMAPATGFYATAGAGTKQVRIAYVLEVALIERSRLFGRGAAVSQSSRGLNPRPDCQGVVLMTPRFG